MELSLPTRSLRDLHYCVFIAFGLFDFKILAGVFAVGFCCILYNDKDCERCVGCAGRA